MTTFFVIVAVLILVIALIAIATTAIEERNWHKANAEHLARQLDQSNTRLAQVLDEHAVCPAPYHSRGAW